MPAIDVNHLVKTFGSVRAVDDVTFAVEQGELFGLLGPNGAGKTTAIRCMLDIFKPDSGGVSILGGAMTEAKKILEEDEILSQLKNYKLRYQTTLM